MTLLSIKSPCLYCIRKNKIKNICATECRARIEYLDIYENLHSYSAEEVEKIVERLDMLAREHVEKLGFFKEPVKRKYRMINRISSTRKRDRARKRAEKTPVRILEIGEVIAIRLQKEEELTWR